MAPSGSMRLEPRSVERAAEAVGRTTTARRSSPSAPPFRARAAARCAQRHRPCAGPLTATMTRSCGPSAAGSSATVDRARSSARRRCARAIRARAMPPRSRRAPPRTRRTRFAPAARRGSRRSRRRRRCRPSCAVRRVGAVDQPRQRVEHVLAGAESRVELQRVARALALDVLATARSPGPSPSTRAGSRTRGCSVHRVANARGTSSAHASRPWLRRITAGRSPMLRTSRGPSSACTVMPSKSWYATLPCSCAE